MGSSVGAVPLPTASSSTCSSSMDCSALRSPSMSRTATFASSTDYAHGWGPGLTSKGGLCRLVGTDWKLDGLARGGRRSLLRSSRFSPACSHKHSPSIRSEDSKSHFRVASGEQSLLVSGLEHHARLVEDIRRTLSKDRQWLQSKLSGTGLSDVGFFRGKGSEQGWRNWNLVFLAAVPGVSGLGLSSPQSVLEALGVLAAIITAHESGHFLAARLQNIHVTKFAIGFGPTLAKFQKKGVEYSLRAFPFGGFVGFPDEDPNSEFSPDDPNLLKNRPILDRALVISAGVIANIIFAYSVLLMQTVGSGILEREMLPGVLVPEVVTNSAAARSGMLSGDIIMAVEDRKLSADNAAVFDLVDTIKQNPERPISIVVERGQPREVVGLKVTPDLNRDGSGRIGVQLSPNAKAHRVKAENVGDAVVKSGREFYRLTAIVLEGLKQIFFNFEKTVDSVSGPVAIVAVGAEVARADVSGLYQFAAIVNINLAIVNLLPLPALDGGYLVFILLEALRGGRKLPDGVEQGIVSSGVLLLLVLGVALVVRDTLNLDFVRQML